MLKAEQNVANIDSNNNEAVYFNKSNPEETSRTLPAGTVIRSYAAADCTRNQFENLRMLHERAEAGEIKMKYIEAKVSLQGTRLTKKNPRKTTTLPPAIPPQGTKLEESPPAVPEDTRPFSERGDEPASKMSFRQVVAVEWSFELTEALIKVGLMTKEERDKHFRADKDHFAPSKDVYDKKTRFMHFPEAD